MDVSNNNNTLQICELWEETLLQLPDKEDVSPSICVMSVIVKDHMFEEPICIFHAPQSIRAYIDCGQEVDLLMLNPEDTVPCVSCLAEANRQVLS